MSHTSPSLTPRSSSLNMASTSAVAAGGDSRARPFLSSPTSHLAERGDDCYETPAVAVHALLRHVHLPRRIWEPAAGSGHIVDVLRGAEHQVLGSDLIDYGRPDFFSRHRALLGRNFIGCDIAHDQAAPRAIARSDPSAFLRNFAEAQMRIRAGGAAKGRNGETSK